MKSNDEVDRVQTRLSYAIEEEVEEEEEHELREAADVADDTTVQNQVVS